MQKNCNTTVYKEELRQRILSVSMALFKKKGIKQVRMDDIATVLGISKRTLYELYGNKEDLLYEGVKEDQKHFFEKLANFADHANNEMEVIVYFVKLKLRDFSIVNPLFFSELHKYKRIVELMKVDHDRQQCRSENFIRLALEHGFLRKDINFALVSRFGEVCMDYVLREQVYKEYSMTEIFRTHIKLFMGACCTEKGIRYIDDFFNKNMSMTNSNQ